MADTDSGKVSFASLVASMGASGVGLFSQMETLLRAAGEGGEEGGAEGEGPEDEAVQRAASMSKQERKQRLQAGLSATREIIDTLNMLEQTTKGNLNEEERELLTSVLTELRLGYTRVAGRVDDLPVDDDEDGGSGESDE